jgi:uncharacterized membrane protein
MSSDDAKTRISAPSEGGSITLEHRSIHIGPLPDAAEFARYEHVLPGAAERILRRAEQEAAHRRALELQVVGAEIQRGELSLRLALRGQTFALAIGLATLASCLSAALTGHEGARSRWLRARSWAS